MVHEILARAAALPQGLGQRVGVLRRPSPTFAVQAKVRIVFNNVRAGGPVLGVGLGASPYVTAWAEFDGLEGAMAIKLNIIARAMATYIHGQVWTDDK